MAVTSDGAAGKMDFQSSFMLTTVQPSFFAWSSSAVVTRTVTASDSLPADSGLVNGSVCLRRKFLTQEQVGETAAKLLWAGLRITLA